MKVLLAHDASVMSALMGSALESAGFEVNRLGIGAEDQAAVRSRCELADAVLFVSTGWSSATSNRELRELDGVINALDGTAKRLLYVSEAAVIGDTGDSFGNEDSPPSSTAPHLWRVVAEQRLGEALSRSVHSIVVRPALVHGRDAGGQLQSLRAYAAATGHSVYVGDGTARTSTVHVDDVISLIRAALVRAPAGSTYVAASGQVVSWRELADSVARATERTCEVQWISAAQAAERGLDAATMTVTNVSRDHAAYRRLGWRPTGAPLATEEVSAAR